jgi:hypothetical protein
MRFLRTVSGFKRTGYVSHQMLSQEPKFTIPDKINEYEMNWLIKTRNNE